MHGEITYYAAQDLNLFCFNALPVAGLICNDMWANPQVTVGPDPRLSQELARKGARVIFHAVNGGRDDSDWSRETIWRYHETNLQMRAAAGKVWIVTVDNAYPTTRPTAAPSGVIGPEGKWACRAEPVGTRYFAHSIAI